MIHRLFFGAVLAAWAGLGFAQTLEVRSGEHADFTRLVIRLPDDTPWRLAQDGRMAQLIVDGADIDFNTDTVFARIPRTRLEGLSQPDSGGVLQLALACNCPVSSFVEQGNYLVLDIGEAIEGQPIQTGIGVETQALQEERDAEVAPTVPFPLLGPETAPGALLANSISSLNRASAVIGGSPVETAATDDAPSAEGLAQSERILEEQISRAATQGLVAVDAQALSDIGQRLENTEGAPNPATSLNIRAVTSVDRDMTPALQGMSLSGNSAYCLDPDVVDLPRWGDDRPFGHQVGAFRTRMAGEFDDLSDRDIMGLAKTYLYFGFGAEAHQLMLGLDPSTKHLEPLMALSRLLESGDLPEPHPFDHQLHCDSVLALWSVYANPLSPRDEVNSGAVIRAFVELPDHIRSLIGPGLLRRFTNAGDSETAELLVRLINRSAPQKDTPMLMAEAEIARLNGDEETADDLVEDVAHSGSQDSPEALITLVERHFETRETLPSETVQLLESYVLELRRDELGSEMARAYSLALALAGDFPAAFSQPTGADAPQARNLLYKNLALLTENADDLTFLELSFDATNKARSGLPVDLKMQMSSRYIDMGFPEAALALLDRPLAQAGPDGYSALRAEAALDAGLPRRALLELVGRSGAEVDELRAEALRASGLHAEAAQIYATLNAPEEAARSEWLAGLPAPEGEEEGTLYASRRTASQRLNEGPTTPQDLSLAAARSLLEQSEAVRRDIELLDVGANAGTR